MPKNPKLYYIGIAALGLSLTWFLLLLYSPVLETAFLDELGAFFVNYAITFAYFLTILIVHFRTQKGVPWHKGDEHTYSIALVLFSISAHSLNFSEIKLFSPYVDWMVAYVILMHVAVLAFPFRSIMTTNLRMAVNLINGAGLVLALYLTIFIFPVFVFAIPGAVFFGISLHATVPFWFFLYFIQAWFRMESSVFNKRAYWLGILIPILAFSVFVYQWSDIQKDIKSARATYQQMENSDLPEWVYLASALSPDLLTQKVLIANGRTQRTYWEDSNFMGSGPSGSQFTRHNPIALAAMILYGDIDMDRRDKIKLLEAQYDCRHMTHRRLWSGEQLITQQIESEIDIFPSYRLAYEQMAISIHHENKRSPDRRWRGNQEEAVYSFYLPEGSIATSLSLWINGIEEKSRLTTKSKADSAYRTIVGRERRDPALMHWQEGNRVTVTVFPCTPEEDRIFKVGFTTPLRYEDGKLILQHVRFDGPAKWKTQTKVRVRFPEMDDLPQSLDLPRFWKKEGNVLTYNDLYQSDWQIRFDAPEMQTKKAFEWKGMTYQLEPQRIRKVGWKPDQIVLDVNASWDWGTYNQLVKKSNGQKLLAFLPKPVAINQDNYREVFEQLHERSFTLLPLYQLNLSQKTLVITASNGHGPLLKDLKQTSYANKMSAFLKENEQDIHFFSFTDELAPYIRSLRELRLIETYQGGMDILLELMEEKKFPVYHEDKDSKRMAISEMNIRRDSLRQEGTLSEGVPDHLYRLFAYQDIMSSIGADYYQKNKIEQEWISKAESAYILSPVSSLIVLESQKDYDRFGIKKNENTVGNAAIDKAIINENGSVPEPHEWVLIFAMSVLLLGLGWKKWIHKQ